MEMYRHLRSIDAPDMNTAEGAQKQDFVVQASEKVPFIVLARNRSDKYGRYVADVWFTADSGRQVAGGPGTGIEEKGGGI
jgi:endonuclease YncB( thermonuclease family)